MEMIYRLGWLLVEIISILSFADLVYCQGCEIELDDNSCLDIFPCPVQAGAILCYVRER